MPCLSARAILAGMSPGDSLSAAGPGAALEQALAAHAQRFAQVFGGRDGPEALPRLFYAPGRVNLMGAHLDYNGGPVMPLSIDRGTFIAVRARADRLVRLRSTLEASELVHDPASAPTARSGAWHDYPLGVLRQLCPADSRRPGLDVLFGGNLPVGAGLSSSASICVGSACALSAAWGLGLDRLRQVEIALDAEREFVGVRCGIMDPYAVGLSRAGHILWLDCKDRSSEHIPFDSGAVLVAVADTGVRRKLARGDFNQRVAEAGAAFAALERHAPGATCLRDVPLEVLERHGADLSPLLRRRAEHVLREVARTFAAREALQAGDLSAFGRAMTAAHRSLRDLYQVSVPELDVLVESAEAQPGVHGARLTGAGFGGCVAILVAREAAGEALPRLAADFERRFSRRPPIEVCGGGPGPQEIFLG